MTAAQFLDEWRSAGVITAGQHVALSALVRKERFPVFLELSALVYLGVVALAAGLAWTIREHFANLGDAVIVGSLGALMVGCLFYCFSRTARYSPGRVEAPTFAFDYLLYLGCLAFATLLGYIEYRFHLLQQRWDAYLLASAVVYFALAYRFDNRFVLSLALSTLAGWFGVRLSSWDVLPATMRQAAVVYGALVAALGIASRRYGVKAHFLDAYLHVGGTAAFLALTSGATERDGEWWLAALLAASSVAVAFGIRSRRFAFVVYGIVYGYVGISVQVLSRLHGDTATLAYVAVSGLLVVAGLGLTSRLFGREP